MSALSTTYYAMSVDILAQIDDRKPSAPPGADKFMTILEWLLWAAVIACIGGFIVAAAMLAYQRMQGGGGDAQGKLVGAMIGAVLVSMSISTINLLAF
ncbi:hypothetical protein [Nocardia sp. NPDC060249]|uniref:hypothetical protein n=1 Tax=Nocardia sp. NPDC060249 TaxID=3347082 RepID=UPI00366A3AE2